MSDAGYKSYVDDVLVAIADKQNGPNLTPINLDDLHRELFREHPQTWLQTLTSELVRRELGKDWGNMNARVFMINGAGLSRAQEIREGRRPKPLVDRLASDRTQKLLNVGAFVISVSSLLVAIVALIKSGS